MLFLESKILSLVRVARVTVAIVVMVKAEGFTSPHEDNVWTSLGAKHWPRPPKSARVSTEVVEKEIWDVLEHEDFQFPSLLILENLQLLEKYVALQLREYR